MDIISYKDTLNRLFIRIIEEKLYENKEVCKQANRMVNLLLGFITKDNNNNGFHIYLIRNLLDFINEGGLSYNNVNMIKKLVKNDCRKTLFACFTYLNDREQIIVKMHMQNGNRRVIILVITISIAKAFYLKSL